MAVLSDQIREIRFNLQHFRYHGSNQSFSLLQPSTVSFPISCKNRLTITVIVVHETQT